VTGAATLIIEARGWRLKTMSGIHLIGTAAAVRNGPRQRASRTD
jgi:hypothetical protein